MKYKSKQLTRGVSALSYGLLVGLIGVVALAAVSQSGSSINELFGETSGTLQGVVDSTGAAQPEPSATVAASPTPDGQYLVINDATLSQVLFDQLGSENTWSLCLEVAPSDPFPSHAVVNTACGSASETLQIDTHGSTWSGAYVSESLGSVYQTSGQVWEYPSGFYFSSVSGRNASVYDHNGNITSSGDVRIEFGTNSSNRFHVNAYKYASNTSHTYYQGNGTWVPGWNMADGGSTNPTLSVHIRIYSR
ncbi:MAG: hypothetical protein Alpg2KO_09060 [Alphaproteobacteria bacterium]